MSNNPNALDLFHDINKYLVCDQDNGSEPSYAMQHCEVCNIVLEFIFALDNEGLIK